MNIDKLIKSVSDKAGITIDQARTAVTTALDEFKGNLPDSLVEQLESLFKESATDDEKKAALTGVAATTAAVNVVVLPHAR